MVLASAITALALLVASATSSPAAAPGAVDKMTNSERLARGFVPAWPTALKRYAKAQSPTRTRRAFTFIPSRSRTDAYRTAERRVGPSATPTPTCQAARATPTSVLPSTATKIWSDDVDDEYVFIDVPFPVRLYDQTASSLSVSTNGVSRTVRSTSVPGADVRATADRIWRYELVVLEPGFARGPKLRHRHALLAFSLLYVVACLAFHPLT